MLCDTVIAADYLSKLYPSFDIMQRMIARAHKFVLAPDMAAAADGLANNTEQILRIIPFCRLPFPVCWFELAQADRPHFVAAPLHFEGAASRPKRVGFLCFALPERQWRWFTIMCWSLTDPRSLFEANVSMITVQCNTKEPFKRPAGAGEPSLGKYADMHQAPFCPAELAGGIFKKGGELRELAAQDWGGEIQFLFSLLGLLNSRNVAEHHDVDNTDYNKKRVKAGKPPLSSHTLLKIRPMHRQSFARPGRPPMSHDEIRSHFVSGHWKTRRTGLFWWNPFMRGNPARGTVSHDYEVTT